MSNQVLPDLYDTRVHFVDAEGNPSPWGFDINIIPTSPNIERNKEILTKCREISLNHDVENLIIFIPLDQHISIYEYYDGELFVSNARAIYRRTAL